MPMNREELRGRLIEVVVVAVISIASSAITVSWSLSATLEHYRTKLDAHDKSIDRTETMVQDVISTNAQQNQAIAINNTQFQEIQRRLDSIDRKLDGHDRR